MGTIFTSLLLILGWCAPLSFSRDDYVLNVIGPNGIREDISTVEFCASTLSTSRPIRAQPEFIRIYSRQLTAMYADFNQFNMTWPHPVVLEQTQWVGCIDIDIINDREQEETESFLVFIEIRFIISTHVYKLVNIFDNDAEFFVPPQLETFENDHSVRVCANIEISSQGSLSTDVDILLSTQSGSAMASTDFVMSNVSYMLNEGDGRGQRCLDVMILGGELGIEADKVFHVVLSVSAVDDHDIIIGNNRTEVIIHDDNLVYFDETMDTVREEDGNITVCAKALLYYTFRRDLRVVLATINETAQESDLITHIFSIQNLTNGVDQLCVSISVYDDRKLEGDETFFVRLIKFPDESLILGSKTEKTVTIIDNEFVSIAESLKILELFSPAHICVTLNATTSQRPFNLALATRSGSAKHNTDYEDTSAMEEIDITIPLHQICINVTIRDDETYRGDREFFADLEVSDPDILAKNNVTRITIIDDDVRIFLDESYTISESEFTGRVCGYVFPSTPDERERTVTIEITGTSIINYHSSNQSDESSAQYCVFPNLTEDSFDGEISFSLFFAVDDIILLPGSIQARTQENTTEIYFITDVHNVILCLPLLVYFPALNEDVQACIDVSGDHLNRDIELTFIKRSLGNPCEASETSINVTLLHHISACINIPNTDERTFQLFFTTDVVGVHLGNQQAIAIWRKPT